MLRFVSSTSSILVFTDNGEQLLNFIKSTNSICRFFCYICNIPTNTVYHELYFAKKGINKIRFSRKTLKPGMYFYMLKTGDEVITKRLVIK